MDVLALKIKLWEKEKEVVSCFVVYEKKGRCFSPLAQRMKVSSIAKQFIHGWKDKNILQGMDQYTKICSTLNYNFFYKYNAKCF